MNPTDVSLTTVSSTALFPTTVVNTEVSPSFEKHLYFPKPSTSKQAKRKINAPSAISAEAWREHIRSKDNEKFAKADANQKRKLQQQEDKM